MHREKEQSDIMDVLEPEATLTLRESVCAMARRMETIYDMANVSRRNKSEQNRKNTSNNIIPHIAPGDFVLYVKHQKDTKLDYTWLGPAVVLAVPTPMVFK